MSRKKKQPKPANTLLGDLESIRNLLEKDSPGNVTDLPEIPTLDDMIDGGLEVDESPLLGKAKLQTDNHHPSVLSDSAIRALLGSEWQQSADGIVAAARNALGEHSADWTSQHARDLNADLQDKLNQTLKGWLSQTLSEHIDELRECLLDAVEEELKAQLDKLVQQESKD